MEEIHVVVKGVVQGVGFRARVGQFARKHSIKGYVRNLDDGQVEICAQGKALAIREFLDEIKKDPGRAVIQGFDVKPEKCGKTYSSFVIDTERD